MHTCVICGTTIETTPGRGRPKKLCSDACRRRRKADQVRESLARSTRKCTVDGCAGTHRAHGLCSTHYNQQLPTRRRKVIKTCDMCGRECEKEARTQQRYAGTYCSLLCRDFAVSDRSGLTCTLPTDHWARWYGKTSPWSLPETRARFFANTCDDCGETFVEIAYGVPSAYCSDQCTDRVHRRRRRAREHNAAGEYRYTQVMRQYLKQGKVCAYCHQEAQGLPDPEHVMPLSRGGRNDMSNLVAACRACNTDKGDLTLDEWVADRERRGLPRLHLPLTGPAYMHLMHTEPTRPAWRHRDEDACSKVAA